MEQNPIILIVQAISGTYLAPVSAYVPIVIAVAAVLAAILPRPVEGSPWGPARKLLDLMAMNIGNARNTTQSGSAGGGNPLSLLCLFVAASLITGCSTSQDAVVAADVQSADRVISTGVQLACDVDVDAVQIDTVASAAGAKLAPAINVATDTAAALCDGKNSPVIGKNAAVQ